MTVRAVRSEEEYKLAFLLPDPTLRKVRDGARVEVDHKSYFNPALYDCFGSSVMVKLDLQDGKASMSTRRRAASSAGPPRDRTFPRWPIRKRKENFSPPQ